MDEGILQSCERMGSTLKQTLAADSLWPAGGAQLIVASGGWCLENCRQRSIGPPDRALHTDPEQTYADLSVGPFAESNSSCPLC